MAKNKPVKKEISKNIPSKKKAGGSFSIYSSKDFLYATVIAIVAFLLYANTLGHGYTLDDYSVIKDNNVTTQGLKGIPVILKTSYRYGYLSVNDGLYRPLSLVMFAAEWNYFPDTPQVSHLVNVLLYAFTCFLLFLLLRRWMKNYNFIIPFITTLLFACHPIHTEIVASIKSRDEILCFLFIISTFYLLINYIESRSTMQLAFSLVSFFLALLSKETGVTMLAVIPLTLYFFTDISVKKNSAITAIYLLPVVIYLTLRHKVLGSTVGLDSVSYLDNSLIAAHDTMSRLATAVKVLGMYFQLLIFPHPLICDRSFNHIPNVTWTDMGSLLSMLLYVGMAVFSLWQLPKKNIFSFAILFYFISIALFSNIVFTIGSVMAERFVYFASFGFCLSLAVLLPKLFKTNIEPAANQNIFKKNISLFGILGVVLALYSFKTISRNKDWKNNYTLYSNDITLAPNSARIHYYLGREVVKETAGAEKDSLKRDAWYNLGIEELKRSTAIAPSYADAYSQMGLGYLRKGDRKKALEQYLLALKYQPNDAITMNNLAAEYFSEGRYAECIEMYNRVLTIDPRYTDAMVNLGSCYGTVRDFDNAIKWFKKAIEVNPNYVRAYSFLSYTYKLKGDNANADLYDQQAKKIDPSIK